MRHVVAEGAFRIASGSLEVCVPVHGTRYAAAPPQQRAPLVRGTPSFLRNALLVFVCPMWASSWTFHSLRDRSLLSDVQRRLCRARNRTVNALVFTTSGCVPARVSYLGDTAGQHSHVVT